LVRIRLEAFKSLKLKNLTDQDYAYLIEYFQKKRPLRTVFL